ncbi:MAG: hypothetical protein IT201_04715 [Thermoleophilia bacterium]|nr:hypothetical protein [Thermoleophilia bacterium]
MRRLGLRIFFASVALNAALAIVALLAGSFGEIEGKILFSSLCVTGALVLVLACEAARGRGRLGPLPLAGSGASLAGFALLMAGVWVESSDDTFSRVTGTVLTPAVAAALVSVLSLADLAPRFLWTFRAAAGLTLVLAGLVAAGIWGEFDGDWYGRWIGVVAVALAAFVIVVPVLARLSRREAGESPAVAGRISFCPACGVALSAAAGAETRCEACGAAFAVTFRRGRDTAAADG